MGYFYFDESLHSRGEFILGAFVYSEIDLEESVDFALELSGLIPGKHEFKSSSPMHKNTGAQKLRSVLKEILKYTKIGLVVIPFNQRNCLGDEALLCLEKIIVSNNLESGEHSVYFDEGVVFSSKQKKLKIDTICQLYQNQDSRAVRGIQLADLAAHSLSTMLLGELGLVSKEITFAEEAGYFEPAKIRLDYEIWSTIRYSFFTQDNIDIEKDDIEHLTLDIGSYALHIADNCSEKVKKATLAKFSKNYIGCIH